MGVSLQHIQIIELFTQAQQTQTQVVMIGSIFSIELAEQQTQMDHTTAM